MADEEDTMDPLTATVLAFLVYAASLGLLSRVLKRKRSRDTWWR